MTREQELRETRKLVHTAADTCQSLDMLDLVHKLLLSEQKEQRTSPQPVRGGGGIVHVPGTGWRMAAR